MAAERDEIFVAELRGCTADYGGTPVLQECRLAIRTGELLAVVGASGVGKTTLLHVLAGLHPPSAGSVQFQGAPLNNPSRRIGIVFQDHALYPWMTIEENVALGLRIRGIGRRVRRSRAAEMLAALGISDCRDAYPQAVSGGQRQRAALARTLVLEPSLILLDEPFSSLDAQTRENLQELSRDRILSAGLSGVIVTHDTEEAVFMGSRIGVLGAGGSIEVVSNAAVGLPRTSREFVEVRRSVRERLNATVEHQAVGRDGVAAVATAAADGRTETPAGERHLSSGTQDGTEAAE
jgi:NitT/TauT family transport system ATP-binding protein